MADGFFPTLVSKDQNANAVANPIVVQVSDGVDTLPIDATNGIPVDVKNIGTVTVTAADLDIRDLSSATDSVSIADGGNSITVDAADLDIRDLNSATDSVTIADGGGSITVDGTVTVTATDLDIRPLTLAEDAVKVSKDTNPNSITNPIYVQAIEAAVTGEVHNYDTSAAVAGGATDNHDVTAVNTLLVKQISVSSSGASKVEFIADAGGTPVTKFVGFIPKQGGTLVKEFNPPVELTTGQVARLARTNREGSAQDLYSTVEGVDA